MTSEQADARRGRLRVARFGETEPDRADAAAPVARFGGPPGGHPPGGHPPGGDPPGGDPPGGDPPGGDPPGGDPPGGDPPGGDPPGGDPPGAVPAGDPPGEAGGEAGGTVSHALLDRLAEQAPAPVAPLREHAERRGQPAEGAPVARFADTDTDTDARPGPVPRSATIADLADGGRPARVRRSPGAGEGVGGESRRPTGGAPDSARRAGRRTGWSRPGAPPELDPDVDPVAVARDICLRLLTDRARTRQELAEALRRKGVPDDAAGAVLERFDEVGLIDDAAFAGQWVRSRHHHKGLARRAIAMELRRKGVDDEAAGEALAEIDTESEELRARQLVDRKLRTVPAATPEQRKKAAPRLVGMLARKGYSGGIAYRVVREALAAHGAEIDELGTDPLD